MRKITTKYRYYILKKKKKTKDKLHRLFCNNTTKYKYLNSTFIFTFHPKLTVKNTEQHYRNLIYLFFLNKYRYLFVKMWFIKDLKTFWTFTIWEFFFWKIWLKLPSFINHFIVHKMFKKYIFFPKLSMSHKKLRKLCTNHVGKHFRKTLIGATWGNTYLFVAIPGSEILTYATPGSENLKTLLKIAFLRISLL